MEEENKEVPALVEQEEEFEGQEEEETIEAIKEARDKALKKASDQEQRAKIAEDKLKAKGSEKKPEAKETKSGELSQTDIFVLTKAGVEIEDLDTIKMLSKSYGLSIQEALGNDEIKEVLKIRKEKRLTAQATFTGKTPKTAGKVSEDAVLSKFHKGDVPETGSAEAEALFWARRGGKR